MTRTEERLRETFADAARAVRPETLRPLVVTAPVTTAPRRRPWVVPLVAAASVGALVAGVTAVREYGDGRSPATVPGSQVLTVRAAGRGIVKITGTAPGCERKVVGSGFVFAPQRVMTTAHAVAGSRGPVEVSVPAVPAHHQATVVLYDSRRDVAVLAVPGLRAPVLAFSATGESGAPAVIAGYPHDAGGLMMTTVRIRARRFATGPDIYRSPSPTRREIFAVRGTVGPGGVGGPLLASDGTVYGMVFATALDNLDTAYALTALEISADARAGRTASRPVSTQGCSY